jgi:hypothetical protein
MREHCARSPALSARAIPNGGDQLALLIDFGALATL